MSPKESELKRLAVGSQVCLPRPDETPGSRKDADRISTASRLPFISLSSQKPSTSCPLLPALQSQGPGRLPCFFRLSPRYPGLDWEPADTPARCNCESLLLSQKSLRAFVQLSLNPPSQTALRDLKQSDSAHCVQSEPRNWAGLKKTFVGRNGK